MTENFHSISRKKVCICGKKAARIISPTEKTNVNEGRDRKINFDKEFVPLGVCKKCDVSIRTRKFIQIGLWEEHGKGVHGVLVHVCVRVFVNITLCH